MTTLTLTAGGGAMERMPAVLPLRCSMSSFCCCLMESMERTCSIAAASSRGMGRPITTGEIDLAASAAGVLTSVLMGCEMPLIVTRRFLLGEGLAAAEAATAEGGGASSSPAAAADCAGSWAEGGGLRVVGDGRASNSASSLIRTLRGERRSLGGEREGIGRSVGGGRGSERGERYSL